VIRKTAARVASVEPLAAPGHHVLTFDAPELARDARPGHFIAVSADTGQSILRKPFSVFTVDRDTGICSILFSVYGPTTRSMSKLGTGDRLDFIGPLGGRVFEPVESAIHHVLVGGGYGVPPLNFLARSIKERDPKVRVTLVHGARTADLLVGADGMADRGVDVLACTDDGSAGVHGRVTVALEPMLVAGAAVYTCGPNPMMRAVAERCLASGVSCQISMETPMPCGVGICVGCVVGRSDGGYSRTCVDGPVYQAGEVRW